MKHLLSTKACISSIVCTNAELQRDMPATNLASQHDGPDFVKQLQRDAVLFCYIR